MPVNYMQGMGGFNPNMLGGLIKNMRGGGYMSPMGMQNPMGMQGPINPIGGIGALGGGPPMPGGIGSMMGAIGSLAGQPPMAGGMQNMANTLGGLVGQPGRPTVVKNPQGMQSPMGRQQGPAQQDPRNRRARRMAGGEY